MILPAGYVDCHPARGPYIAASSPPEQYSWTVEVLMPTGEVSTAVWTGKVWWAGEELRPIGWRSVDPFAGVVGYAPAESNKTET